MKVLSRIFNQVQELLKSLKPVLMSCYRNQLSCPSSKTVGNLKRKDLKVNLKGVLYASRLLESSQGTLK